MFFKNWREGGGLGGMFGQEAPVVPWTDPDSGKVFYQDEFDAQQKELDFRKEFMQSMFGGKKLGGKDSVGSVAVGGGMRNFETNPLMTTPEISQYAPTPGFSLVRPLQKKHWYDYGGTA